MPRLRLPALVAAAFLLSTCGSEPVATTPSCRGPLLRNETLFENAEVEPFLAIDPGSPAHLVGVWQQDRYSGGGAISLLAQVTFDGGTTWASSSAPFSRCSGGTAANGGDYDRASDPWVAISPDGTAHQLALAFSVGANGGHRAILASRSTDGGRNWSTPQTVQGDSDTFFALDKGSITADPHSSSFVYAVWDRLTHQAEQDSPDTRGPAWFARSTDGGASWEAARSIYDPGANAQTIGNVIAVLPDGTLLNAMLVLTGIRSTDVTQAKLAVLRSTDRGATWPDPPVIVRAVQNITLLDPKTQRPVRTGGALPSIAVDGSTGNVHLVWEDSRFSNDARNGIALSTSADGGLTWSAPIQANRAPSAPAFTPAVAAGGGKVGVAYYDLRDDVPADASRFQASSWLASSGDGGATWQEMALAGPFDLQTAPIAQGYFLGDYQGLGWDGTSFVSFFAAANSGNAADRTSLLFRRVAPP
jgi:BNR repeat-like domain